MKNDMIDRLNLNRSAVFSITRHTEKMPAHMHLTSNEIARCRDSYERYVEDYVETVYQLRTLCAEFGQFPSDEELEACLRVCGGRLNFNTFCQFALYLKYQFKKELFKNEDDEDSSRCFAAMGGMDSEDNTIHAQDMLETCSKFALNTDLLCKLVEDLDQDHSGTISYEEFRTLALHDQRSQRSCDD